MTEDSRVRDLRKRLDDALNRQKDVEAIELLRELIEVDPKQPRWPHKRGDLYRKKGRKKEAVECYTAATSLYAAQGFLARAIAMAKTVVDLDARQINVLERLDPEAAHKLHRQQRPAAVSARPPAATPPERTVSAPIAPVRLHPALMGDDEPAPTHPAVVLEGNAAKPRQRPLPPPPPPPPAASVSAHAGRRGPERVRDAVRRQTSGASPLPTEALPVDPAPVRAKRRARDVSQSLLEMAEELRIAPDVQPHETRFSDAPPERPKVGLTDVDMTPRKAATAPDSLRPAPPSAKKLSKLPLFPLFAEIPQAALVDLVKASEMLELPDEAVVMQKGELADALYGIVEGSVDIVVPGQTLRTTLAEGDVFGESCLLVGEKRHADVVVRGYLVALRIPREAFNPILVAYPRVAEVLLELLTRRLLGNLLQSSPLFQEFDGRGRQQLVQLFEIRRAPRGMLLAAIGKAMDGLYINLTGSLEVRYADGRPNEQHDTGTMFGQSSLLSHVPSDISVTARANMLVLRLPAAAFHTIAMQYPGMLAHISDLSSSSVARVSG